MPSSANPDAAFGHLRDGVCLVAPDGGVRYANASFLEILELVGHEGPVEHIWDVLPGDGGGPDAELLRHSLEERVPVCFRTDAGGSRVWQVEVEPAGRGDMRVRLRNVTAEVRAEAVERSGEALLTVAEREARLDTILESSPVGYVLMDADTFVVREANRASHEILEDPWRTPGSTVGHPMSELVPGFAASDIEEVFRRVRDTGEPFDVAEWEFRGFARGPAFFRWSLRAVPREGGAPPRFLLLLVVDVTAEVLARRAAETERRGLFAVLDALPVGVLVARAPGGETAYVNPAAATLAGRPAAELAAADEAEHAALWDGRHPSGERMAAGERPLARALRGEPVRDVELVLPRPDGGSRTLLASAEPLRGEGGQVERAVVSLHDVSDRRALEEALVERTAAAEAAAGEAALRAEESRALREMGRALVSALDPEQVLRMAAASAMELTGARGSCVVSPRGAESMVLSPCVGLLERLEGTVLPLAGSAADVAVNAGRPVVFNSPEELPGGNEVLATARSLGLRNLLAAPMLAFGEALGVLVAVDREGGFGEDETRLLESFADSAALAVHNARLYEGQRRRAEENRALLAAAEALTSTLDPAEVMERIVHIARELVGADAAGLTLVTGENRDRLLTPVAVGLLEPFRGSEGALAGSLTEVAARASGPVVIDADAGEPLHPNAVFMQRLGIVYFAVLPLRVEGELLGMIGVANARGSRPFGAQDLRVLALLADQAVLAVRNARAHETARGASRAKSEFLAMMSHELRTPLNALAGFSSLMEEGIYGPVTDAQRTALGRMAVAREQLMELIEQVLDMAKVEAGRKQVDAEEVPLGALVRGVVEALHGAAERKRLSLTVDVHGAPRLRTDPRLVRQIVVNLVGNAVKFTDTGGISVRVSAADAGGGVVEVGDTGPGIPAAHHERIFEPFYQADASTTRRQGGSGLGLALSREFAHLLGGSLTVRSTPDGSTFTLTLPADAPRADTTPADAPAAPAV